VTGVVCAYNTKQGLLIITNGLTVTADGGGDYKGGVAQSRGVHCVIIHELLVCPTGSMHAPQRLHSHYQEHTRVPTGRQVQKTNTKTRSRDKSRARKWVPTSQFLATQHGSWYRQPLSVGLRALDARVHTFIVSPLSSAYLSCLSGTSARSDATGPATAAFCAHEMRLRGWHASRC
jgi:hypothetical protein